MYTCVHLPVYVYVYFFINFTLNKYLAIYSFGLLQKKFCYEDFCTF